MKFFIYSIAILFSLISIAQTKEKSKEVESKTIISLKNEDKYIKSLLKPVELINIKDRSDLVFINFLENKVKWDKND
ncbi:hypothetical protein [Photobacterium damselae]|uniref:hypothetical protein n=1 Tax=Photobacterium damselae TaxID=38293 RepID=UPI004068326F